MPPSAPATEKSRKTRAALLSAARQIAGQSGAGGVSVKAVCEAAAVGRTSFYNYFPDTGALLTELATELADSMRARFELSHGALPRGEKRLETCLSMILHLATEDRETGLLLTALSERDAGMRSILSREIAAELTAIPGLSASERARLTRHLTLTTLALARAAARGETGADDLPAHVRHLMAPCRQAVQAHGRGR